MGENIRIDQEQILSQHSAGNDVQKKLIQELQGNKEKPHQAIVLTLEESKQSVIEELQGYRESASALREEVRFKKSKSIKGAELDCDSIIGSLNKDLNSIAECLNELAQLEAQKYQN